MPRLAETGDLGYAITPLRLDAHRDALARLWAENMSDARIASVAGDRMRWLYDDPPARGATTVLCLESASGEVVGCASFLPRTTWVDGRPVRGALLCDFAVARAHRVGGAAIALQRELVERARAEGVELLYGHPNEKSVAVFKRVGYRVVGEATAWAKPLRFDGVLDGLLSGPAASIAAAPMNAAVRVFDRARSAGTALRVRGELVSGDDPRLGALWERARAQYGVVGEQSVDYLRWRYARFTTARYRFYGVLPRDEGRLAGFAVYVVDGPKAVLCDLFADHLETSAEAMLLSLGEHLRAEGAESMSLSYVGPREFGSQLMSVGFLPRPGRRPLVLHPAALSEALLARVMDPTRWFMLEGELDI